MKKSVAKGSLRATAVGIPFLDNPAAAQNSSRPRPRSRAK